MRQVLVIDDEPDIREGLAEMLESSGYRVTIAANGREGLRLYKEGRFDLVITDIIMPDQEGIETIRAIRKQGGDAKIIAMSGGGLVDPLGYLSMARKLGADRIFEKPLDFDDLLAAMSQLLAA